MLLETLFDAESLALSLTGCVKLNDYFLPSHLWDGFGNIKFYGAYAQFVRF